MFKLLRFLKKLKPAAIIAPLLKFTEALFELFIPLVVARIIDIGIKNQDVPYIWKMSAFLLSLGAAGLAFAITSQYLAARVSAGFGQNLRGSLFKHINTLSYNEIDRFGSASLVTRLTSDVSQCQLGLAMFIRLMLRSPFLAAGSVVMAMTIDLKLSVIFVIVAAALSAILYFLMSKSAPLYKTIQLKLDNLALLTEENVSGSRVVRAFNKQKTQERDFKTAAESLARTSRSAGRIAALVNPLTYAVVNLAIIAVLWFGAAGVNTGRLSAGQITALVNYLTQILLSLLLLAMLIVTFTKASASAKRINEIFAVSSNIEEPLNQNAPALVEGSAKISLKNVSFSYGSNAGDSLEDISLEIQEGKTVGIIGPTGAGKTTLINLICRFYDVRSGAVEIDGVNIKQYPSAVLRKKIGIVPQKAALFSGSVRDNVRFGNPDATDEEVWRALKTAQAEEFVQNLPQLLDYPVSEGGKNLSGGQRQRLTIARALCLNPEILILDDSASALDYATDASLRHALKQQTSNMTVIIISQRASSIKHADVILCLEEGKTAGIGTHGGLIETCPVYKEICLSQE